MIIERIKYFFCHVSNDWQIGIIKSDLRNFLFSNSPYRIHWMESNFQIYKADPFGIEKDGKLYLFYEEYLKSAEYAILKCAILDKNLQIIDDQIILDDGTHKSFPFVFQHIDKYYLMPESGCIDKLIFYEALDFPFIWLEKQVLLNFAVSDAIIEELDNKWYLFYCKSKTMNENEILFVRVSDNLFCDWQKIEENIVKVNFYDSRNAGKIVNFGGKYYRFAQNCKNQYGESVVVNEIIDFEIARYEEKFILEKKLSSLNNGFHTLNSTDNFVLVDRRVYKYKFKSFAEIFNQIYSLVIKQIKLKKKD